jgi:hypothetical protein
MPPERELVAVRRFRKGITGDTEERDYFPYGGKTEWEPDSEPEREDGEDNCVEEGEGSQN